MLLRIISIYHQVPLGYFSIFLFGLDAGKLIFSLTLQNTRIIRVLKGQVNSRQSGYGNLARVLVFWSVVYYALFNLSMLVIDGTNGEQVSRRIANLPYILWVVAFNFGFVLIFTLVDIGISRSNTIVTVPKLFESININGLVVFLVVSILYIYMREKYRSLFKIDIFLLQQANLLTGLVNMSMRTLYASTAVSLIVCATYMFIVTKFAWVLWYQFQVRIKL